MGLLFLCVVYVGYAAAQGGTEGFNKLIAMELPLINTQLQGAMPESIGDCENSGSDTTAAAPCETCTGCNPDHSNYLFYVHKSWKYKAFARWISGLKSVSFSSVVLTNSTTGALNGLSAAGAFASLPASIYVGECFTFDKCSELWDNRGACCGANKHFSFEVDVQCNSTSHELQDLGLKSLTIDPFEVTESIVGIDLNPVDISTAVHDQVSAVLNKYLTTAFINYNGSQLTLVQYLNAKGSYYVSQLC